MAVSSVWAEVNGLVGLAGLVGILLIVAALFAVWDDGLVAGAVLLFAGYAVSVGGGEQGLDRAAPLIAVALVGVVEFGSWSLELRDGAEERPIGRVPAVLLLLVAAFASNALVLGVGAVRMDVGLTLWIVGVFSAVALLTLFTRGSPRVQR